MPEISLPSAVDVLTQLVTGPSLREVATTTLRQALKTLYPNLEIDPQRAMVATPTWVITDEHATPGADQFESLTDALVRHFDGRAGTGHRHSSSLAPSRHRYEHASRSRIKCRRQR